MALHAAASSKAIHELVRDVAASIGGTLAELQDRAAMDNREAAASRAEVDRMLDAMAAMNAETQQTIAAARRDSQLLAKEISAAVTTMQFQDTVSQRIAHVVQSLKEMHSAFQRHVEGSNGVSPQQEQSSSAGHDWIGSMSRHYTMASEHEALAACERPEVGPASDENSNVELF